MTSLQHSKVRLEQIVANLQGGVLVENEHRDILLVNDSFCKMFSIPTMPEQLIGKNCSGGAEASKALFKNPEKFVQDIADILKAREKVLNEVLHLVDERVLQRDFVPLYDGSDYIGNLWHYQDVTQAHHTQQRMQRFLLLEQANREIIRLFMQLENVDAVVNEVMAMTGELLDVSRVYVFRFRDNERLLDNTHEWCAAGILPEIENLQGLPFDDILPSFFPMIAEHEIIAPYHIDELPDDIRGILEPQDIKTVLWIPFYMNNRMEGFIGYDETRHPRQWLPEEVDMARMFAESYVRALERKLAENTMIRARDEALRTAQMRFQFVANMSHEIRTPMTGTLGMLELLLETELDELQREFANEAYNSSSRLLGIINDILDFSKLDTGRIVLEETSISLQDIAQEVKMTLAPQVKDKPVDIRIEAGQEVPQKVYGDATRIRQILMNLAGNAVKFTHDGHVTIKIDLTHKKSDMAYLRFSVTDTGIGISTSQQENIFESFVQADGSTTRQYGGSGLGLSISKQLVELMGGTLAVDSQPGQGSTFYFSLYLPISQESSNSSLKPMQLDGLRVLVADSNRTACYVLAQQLENWSMHVSQATSIGEAAKQFDIAEFDVIFERYQDIKARAISTSVLDSYRWKTIYILDALEVPANTIDRYLTWPLNRSELYNLIMAIADRPDEMKVPDEENTHREKGIWEHTGEKRHLGRILVADDYEPNIRLVTRSLSSLPIEMVCATNGQEVLEHLQKGNFDLILLDMQMPVMDGIETTQRIRQSSTLYTDIPIVALTANVLNEQEHRYWQAGVDEVIGKPFAVDQLREVVIQTLAKRTNDTVNQDAV